MTRTRVLFVVVLAILFAALVSSFLFLSRGSDRAMPAEMLPPVPPPVPERPPDLVPEPPPAPPIRLQESVLDDKRGSFGPPVPKAQAGGGDAAPVEGGRQTATGAGG